MNPVETGRERPKGATAGSPPGQRFYQYRTRPPHCGHSFLGLSGAVLLTVTAAQLVWREAVFCEEPAGTALALQVALVRVISHESNKSQPGFSRNPQPVLNLFFIYIFLLFIKL